MAADEQVHPDRKPLKPHRAAHVRHFDLLPHTLALPRPQRGQYPQTKNDAANLVRWRPTHRYWMLRPRRSRRHHQPSASLPACIQRRHQRVGPLRSKTGRGRVHQPRIDFLQRVVVHAQSLRHAVAEVFDDNIRLCHQLMHYLPALLGLQIHRNATLIAVAGLKVSVATVRHPRIRRLKRRDRAPDIAVQRLQLDDIRPHIPQHRRRHRPELPHRPVQHLHPRQRPVCPTLLRYSCSVTAQHIPLRMHVLSSVRHSAPSVAHHLCPLVASFSNCCDMCLWRIFPDAEPIDRYAGALRLTANSLQPAGQLTSSIAHR